MKIYPDKLKPALNKGLAPVYLFAGPETLVVLEACDAVRRACRENGVDERIVLEAGGRFDWNELAMATETGSLFATRRLVELRIPSGKPGREGSAAIKSWVEGDPSDVLLISCMEWKMDSERTAWVRSIEKHGVYMPAWTIKPGQMPRWLQARARSRGLELDRDAAARLAELMEGNLLAAAQTVDRLALHPPPGGRLDAGNLANSVDDHARFDAYRLSELVLTGQVERALRCSRGLAAEDAPRPLIVAALAGDLQNLLALQDMSGTMPLDQAMGNLRIFPSKRAQFESALRRLSPAAVLEALAGLGRIDLVSKGQAPGNFRELLERWIVATGGSERARGAA